MTLNLGPVFNDSAHLTYMRISVDFRDPLMIYRTNVNQFYYSFLKLHKKLQRKCFWDDNLSILDTYYRQ